jgi:Cys-tRNA(Pro)/Cys-tRNA(Cys) deacylase
MNEIRDHKESVLSEAEVMRLELLKETLNSAHIHYTIFVQDLIIRSAQEGVDQGLGELANMAPTFILRSDLGYRAAIIRGDTRLSYKKIKRELQLKNLCLASPEEVKQVTNAEIGYVSLFNPGIATIIDDRLMEVDTIFGGCGVPRYTLKINPRDLIAITQAKVFDFIEPKEKDQS